MMTVQSEQWDVDGDRYHAVTSGHQPPRFLMLHANGFNGGTYAPLLEALAKPDEGWAAPDFRGHGGSFHPAEIRNWNVFIKDILRWKGAGHFSKPVAIGHSFGGVTALLAEAQHPGLFSAIVLVDPVVFSPAAAVPLVLMQQPPFRTFNPIVKQALRRRMEFPDVATMRNAYARREAFAAWQPAFLDAYLHWGTVAVDGGVRLACDKSVEAKIFGSWPASFWFRVRKVQCPVLILRGRRSHAFSASAARALHRRLPHSDFREFADAGHFLPMEQPGDVVAAIRAWLDSGEPHS